MRVAVQPRAFNLRWLRAGAGELFCFPIGLFKFEGAAFLAALAMPVPGGYGRLQGGELHLPLTPLTQQHPHWTCSLKLL